jgi:hypothetical protein
MNFAQSHRPAGGAPSASTRAASRSRPRKPSPCPSPGCSTRSSTTPCASSGCLDGELRERTASKPKSARFDWSNGETRVIVDFTAKGESKSVIALAHERLSDAAEAERMKAFWRGRLNVLKSQLERGDHDD